MSEKIVSRKYVLREFSQVGLILILYALFALYIPYIIEKYIDLSTIPYINNIFSDSMLTIRIICICFASLFPFLALYLSDKKNYNLSKISLSLKDRFAYAVVFISFISFVVYISGSILTFFGIETTVLTDIGLPINTHYFNNFLYMGIYICVLPILEEFAFRKVLLNTLSKYGDRFAILTCSLIYAFAHCNIAEFIPSLFMGYLLSKIYLKFRSFSYVSFVHVLYNLIMFLAMAVDEQYNMFVFILLLAIMLIALILIISKKFNFISLPHTDFNKNTFWMFLSCKSVILSLLMFITFAIIQIVL